MLCVNSKILSKSESLSNAETLKTIFKNLSNNSAVSKPEVLSDNYKPISCQTFKTFHRAITIGHNVGSYTQGRTAGDFLSSRNAAWAERCPPKTTAAELDG